MIKKVFFIALAALFLYSCGEDNVNDPRGSKEAPAQVTVTKVNDRPGSSVIYFSRPADNHLKYVRAAWTTDDGIKMDATASVFTDSILIEGFGSAGTYDVEIYSVSAGETSSEPVHQSIHPQTPPYLTAFDNLQVFPFFMGIRGSVPNNETKAKLSFYIYKKNVTGEWEEIGAHHSVAEAIEFRVAGQDTIETEFGVRIRDQYQHWSDIKTFTCTPWWETLCPKNLYREGPAGNILPSDASGHLMHSYVGSIVSFAALWDNSIMRNLHRIYTTIPNTPLPQSFVIDLGKVYTLSRMLMYPRGLSVNLGAASNDFSWIFYAMPLHVRLYGSTYLGDDPSNLVDDITNPDAWVLLADHWFRRADGTTATLTESPITTEEIEMIEKTGFEVMFSSEAPPKLRYFRFQTISTYLNPGGISDSVVMDELEFYGSDK